MFGTELPITPNFFVTVKSLCLLNSPMWNASPGWHSWKSPTHSLRKTAEQLNDILAMVEQLRSVDTTGIEPLAHPVSAYRDDVSLRLRDDAVTEENHRTEYQACAPAVENGLYLVPKVIE